MKKTILILLLALCLCLAGCGNDKGELSLGRLLSDIELEAGDSVSVISKKYKEATKEIWYKTSAGWVRGGNLKFSLSGLVHDLNYVDSITFAENILAWHHASSQCIPGLLYRRLSEAKIFLYSDYEQANKSNTNYKKNTYGFIYPNCVSKYE